MLLCFPLTSRSLPLHFPLTSHLVHFGDVKPMGTEWEVKGKRTGSQIHVIQMFSTYKSFFTTISFLSPSSLTNRRFNASEHPLRPLLLSIVILAPKYRDTCSKVSRYLRPSITIPRGGSKETNLHAAHLSHGCHMTLQRHVPRPSHKSPRWRLDVLPMDPKNHRQEIFNGQSEQSPSRRRLVDGKPVPKVQA